MSKPSDLVQGTLDLLILKILALEPLHGFAISARLRQVSGDVLQVSDGSLYPALHKLEQEGKDITQIDNNSRQEIEVEQFSHPALSLSHTRTVLKAWRPN